MWAADVYQGAPTLVTAFLSVASKTAGVGVLFHLYIRVFIELIPDWSPVLAIAAFATMTLGNLVAIVQENVKRFMAFSSISQAGYILMGFLGPTQEGVVAILFYLLVYAVSNLTVFGVIILYSSSTRRENISEYRGLSRTHPGLALIMMLGLFSLAGIPPLSGFTGKFFLFSAAAKAGYYWLVVAAAVNSTISLYYYLRIVRQMYIEAPDGSDARVQMSWMPRLALGLALLGTVLLGVVPVF
jgi:NADH-quinone oxidoreductase subunit N